jgi:hypothetical protein
MKLSENEYREFLLDLESTIKFLKTYMNNVMLKDQIPFPYNLKEFDWNIAFKNNAVYFLLDVKDLDTIEKERIK